MSKCTRGIAPVAIVSALMMAKAAQAGTVLDFYQLAIDNDQTLAGARFQRDAALETKPQARAALLPQAAVQGAVKENRFDVLSINNAANTSYKKTKETYASQTYALQLSQTLFDWGAFKKLAAADSAVAQAEAAYRSAEQTLAVRFVTAYVAVLAAQDTLRADLDAQAAYKQQFDQQDAKYRSGLASVTDARNAQASYDTSTATVITDTVALNNAKRALAVIIGRPVDKVDSLRDEISLVPPNPNSVDSWVETAKNNNLDVISARYAAESAKQMVSAAGGARLPTLSAVGVVSRDTSSSTFGYDSDTAYVGLNLNWTLYHGGQVSSSIRQAEAGAKQAQAAYDLQLRTTDQNVRSHYEGVVSGIAAVKASVSAVASQQSSVVATEVGFKVGTRTIIDALNTRQALVGAQKSLAQARYNYLTSLMQLKADVGQLSTADLEDLDRLMAGGAPGPAKR